MQTTWQSAATLASVAFAVSMEWAISSSRASPLQSWQATLETNTSARTRHNNGKNDEAMLAYSFAHTMLVFVRYIDDTTRWTTKLRWTAECRNRMSRGARRSGERERASIIRTRNAGNSDQTFPHLETSGPARLGNNEHARAIRLRFSISTHNYIPES